MTSANVSGVMQMQDLITRVNKLSEEIGTGVDFSAMVQKQVTAPDELKNETAIPEVKASETKEQANTSYEKQKSESQAVKSQVRSEKRTVSKDMKEKLQGETKNAKADIKETIAKVLGVSEEDIVNAMEALGLQMSDLAEPKNLGLLVANLSGNEDPAALLISEEFMGLVTDVKDIIADYAAANDMAPAEFVQLMSEMETLAEPQEFAGLTDDVVAEVVQENAPVLSDTNQPSSKDNTVSDRVVTTDENGEVAVTETTENGDTKTVVVKTETDSEEEFSDDETADTFKPQLSEAQKKTENADFANAQATINHASVSNDNAVSIETQSAEPVPQAPVNYDAQQVINDIITQARTVVANDQTEVQMVLNPEELGKLMLSVNSSKEGNITARFTVETEIAKEILEQQMVLLRENLNTQGVKVDAVEVTVSSHAFEENLEGEFQREQNEGEHAEAQQQNRRRNINLDDLSELGGLMSEEEMLVASIMRDNGNTVNFTA